MFHLIHNLNPMLAEPANSIIERNSQPDAFGNLNAAHRVTQIDSGFFYAFTFSAYTDIQVQSREITVGVSIGNLINVNTMSFFLAFHNGVHFPDGLEAISPPSNGFSNYRFKTVSSSLSEGFRIAIRPSTLLDISVTRRFDFFGEFIIIDSLNSVYLNPEYDLKQSDKKLESKHRRPIGQQEIFKWGNYKKNEFSIKYISRDQRSIINSYWSTNTELIFTQSGQAEINSVHLTNKNIPINQFVLPYNNLFQGVIELETY